QLHHDLGRFYAEHVHGKPAFVGLHGQTIFHNPAKGRSATLQLGEPAWLAQALGVTVVNNFRAADLAVGGQGAPLATMFHRLVFAERGKHVCVNNLGGISNVTSLDWRLGKEPHILAFDTGPANILINLAVRHFTKGKLEMDRDGLWALKGKVNETLLRHWLAHPYIRKPPPKSTGRELFGEAFLVGRRRQLSRPDLIATLTEFTARSIAINYKLHLPSKPHRVILAGGGAANRSLVRALKRNLPDLEIVSTHDLGWPLQTIEPAAFALLAYLRMRNRPGNLPKTTGAHRPVLLGQITLP
ncbi:MAG TPA: anhydro-N-acetylmuramic acid kinase, partial [Verrucomicrobiae bacterium]|nr:anhydro-N-acetylmuramic acid kinase [Verrucomicrobiae bacterium]